MDYSNLNYQQQVQLQLQLQQQQQQQQQILLQQQQLQQQQQQQQQSEQKKPRAPRAPRKPKTVVNSAEAGGAAMSTTNSNAATQRNNYKAQLDLLTLRFKSEQQKRALLLRKVARAEKQTLRIQQEYICHLQEHILVLKTRNWLDVTIVEAGIRKLEQYHIHFCEMLGEQSRKQLAFIVTDEKLLENSNPQEVQKKKEERDGGLYAAWQNDLKPPRLKSYEEAEKLLDDSQVLLYQWEADLKIWERILAFIYSQCGGGGGGEAEKSKLKLADLNGALELSRIEILSLKQQLKLLENTSLKQALLE